MHELRNMRAQTARTEQKEWGRKSMNTVWELVHPQWYLERGAVVKVDNEALERLMEPEEVGFSGVYLEIRDEKRYHFFQLFDTRESGHTL